MRHPIEKSPRDGTAIILEDDASGTYDVAHWSTEAGEWLGENGEPIKIAPTHWYPIPRDQYLSREDEGARDQPRSGRSRRLASIDRNAVAAALIVTYFRAEVAGYVTRYAGQQDFLGVNQSDGYITGLLAYQGSRKSTVAAERQVEAGQASAPAQAQQTAKVKQPAAVKKQAMKQPVAEKKSHRLVLQVNVNDPATMNLALNNATNVAQYYKDRDEKVAIEIITFGPGLHMLRDDTSPVKARIKTIKEANPAISFQACGNTQENMHKVENKDIPLVPEATVVKSGVVRVMELQEQGWTYVKP